MGIGVVFYETKRGDINSALIADYNRFKTW